MSILMCWKRLIGDLEFANRWNDVLGHFGALARNALPGPLSDILPHAGPDNGLGDALACSFDARVSQAVEDFEDSSSGCVRNVRAGGSVADIDYEVLGPNANGHEIEP